MSWEQNDPTATLLAGTLFVLGLLFGIPATLGLLPFEGLGGGGALLVVATLTGPVLAVLVGGTLVFRYQEFQLRRRVREEKLWDFQLDVARSVQKVVARLSDLRALAARYERGQLSEREVLADASAIHREAMLVVYDMQLAFGPGEYDDRVSRILAGMTEGAVVTVARVDGAITAMTLVVEELRGTVAT